MEFIKKVITLFTLLILREKMNFADLKGAKGTKCFNKDRTVSPNQFLSSISGPLYLSMISRLDLYSLLHDLLPQPQEEIIEGAMYNDGCFRFSVSHCKNVPSQQGWSRNSPSKAEESCICLSVYEPVCGSDGKTYGNICELYCAKMKNHDLIKVYDGPCIKK